jgi:hypothetical protein
MQLINKKSIRQLLTKRYKSQINYLRRKYFQNVFDNRRNI